MNCPFCGIVSDAPHESQQSCIDALNGEIRRMRAVLEQVRAAEVPGAARTPPSGDDQDRQ